MNLNSVGGYLPNFVNGKYSLDKGDLKLSSTLLYLDFMKGPSVSSLHISNFDIELNLISLLDSILTNNDEISVLV